MKKAIIFLAVLLGLIGGMTVGWRGAAIWAVGVLAVLILVKRSWRTPAAGEGTQPPEGS